MLNNTNTLLLNLHRLGLSTDESALYLALLEKPMTHLELARKTKINRTKIYRLADDLEARSLITTKQRDDGRFLAASDPANLEVMLVSQEAKLSLQKQVFAGILPHLSQLYTQKLPATEDFFTIDTYEGEAGLKQMLWNELKTKSEICIFAHDSLDAVAGTRWAEKYRAKMTEKQVPHRVLENDDATHVLEHTKVDDYQTIYNVRYLPRTTLDLQQELTIHDETVSIYNWNRSGKGAKVGLEIHNQDFANFIKAMFETYWNLAK